tara:strand:- start:390 stop:560 length:171 start_codon:yes stop_codon:yes gene_type:complete
MPPKSYLGQPRFRDLLIPVRTKFAISGEKCSITINFPFEFCDPLIAKITNEKGGPK